MRELSDDDLLKELKRRFVEKNAFHDLQVMTKKLEQVNEKLRQSESLKTNFLSNIRNEINNPLSVILGMSKQLTGITTDPRMVERLAEMIYREAFELDFQLNNIFVAAELEAGEASVGLSRTNVDGLIRNLIDSFEQRAAEKGIDLSMAAIPTDLAEGFYFNTDPEKLYRILANLLANAIEFSPEQKPVRIAAEKDGAQLLVSIHDEGAGIPEKDRERIFDRFTQLDMGTTKRHRGHGLGLSVAKALADMLGGTITLSCPPHGGCVFTLALQEADGEPSNDFSEAGNVFVFDEMKKF